MYNYYYFQVKKKKIFAKFATKTVPQKISGKNVLQPTMYCLIWKSLLKNIENNDGHSLYIIYEQTSDLGITSLAVQIKDHFERNNLEFFLVFQSPTPLFGVSFTK